MRCIPVPLRFRCCGQFHSNRWPKNSLDTLRLAEAGANEGSAEPKHDDQQVLLHVA